MSVETWEQVVTAINRSAGTRYRLGERLAGGRQGGAWLVTDHSSTLTRRQVLTWTANPGLVARRSDTARIVTSLHESGYPTPAWRHWGILDSGIAYTIADFAAGRPGTWASVPVAQLIAAVELQAGVAGPSPNSWSQYLTWALTAAEGPRGDLDLLGDKAAWLLRHVDKAASRIDHTTLPTEDAVHGDLEIGNILVTDGPSETRIAIIDIDACGPGTRAIDYAWLYRDATSHGALEAGQQLERAGRAIAGDNVWQACLALACLELVAFVARNGTQDQVDAELTRMKAVIDRPAR